MFPERERIVLAEPPDDPIAEITHLNVTDDGGLLVTDALTHRVIQFRRSGELVRILGRPGVGPGELDEPRAAAEGPQGEVVVVQQGSPRVTAYWPNDSVSVAELPGHYGFWLARTGAFWIAGVATREDRFAILSSDLVEVVNRFGPMAEEVLQTPFWIFLARDRAAVLSDRAILLNNSFSPVVQVLDGQGNEQGQFGVPPASWVQPTEPPIDRLSQPGDSDRITEWSKTFTVVTGLAVRGDSIVVVQYGRHDPADQDRNRLRHQTADLYEPGGNRIREGVLLERRILAGGERLYLLSGEPPEGWTITVH
ncbi:MAG: hypothetical protein ACR2QM_14370 [Longimicrobiales bacterium]